MGSRGSSSLLILLRRAFCCVCKARCTNNHCGVKGAGGTERGTHLGVPEVDGPLLTEIGENMLLGGPPILNTWMYRGLKEHHGGI